MIREIVTAKDVDPRHEAINNFLGGRFSAILEQYSMAYYHRSPRTIKPGNSTDDQIYHRRAKVGDIHRIFPVTGAPILEIVLCDNNYQTQIEEICAAANEHNVAELKWKPDTAPCFRYC